MGGVRRTARFGFLVVCCSAARSLFVGGGKVGGALGSAGGRLDIGTLRSHGGMPSLGTMYSHGCRNNERHAFDYR
jgi:hypothetical protein